MTDFLGHSVLTVLKGKVKGKVKYPHNSTFVSLLEDLRSNQSNLELCEQLAFHIVPAQENFRM